tara:strand:+ start:2835 stop:4214 length:1380 start_codon:yes stop_codon:yes gene_type:complete
MSEYARRSVPEGITAILKREEMAGYLQGVRREVGRSPCVLLPESTAEVAVCVRHCSQSDVPFVPQSGNTGLVGASIPDETGRKAVLSLEKLRGVFEIDLANRSLTVSAGFRLSEVNDRLAPHGLFFPIDLGADPMIGGMIATNTGGSRFLRYGDVRQNVLGLKVVLNTPDADVLTLGSAARKNNTGPDWKQNYIGTSGWYGVVTEATLNLEPVIKEQATAIVVPSSDEAMLGILQYLEARVGPLLSAFEFMSGSAMRHAFAHVTSLSNSFAGGVIPSNAILIELSRTTVNAPWDAPIDDVLQTVLMEVWSLENALLKDALFGRAEEIWALRHALSEGVKSAGPLIAFDLGFTRDQVIAFRASMALSLPVEFPKIEICDFGHLGDGGLHFNLVKTDGPLSADYERKLRDWVMTVAVEQFGASYSAEHGIGPKNIRYFQKYCDVTPAQLLKQTEVFTTLPS